MSLQAHSQTVTGIRSDSLVMVPKQLAIYMLQDLSQCDSDRIELTILKSQSALKDSIIVLQEEAFQQIVVDNDSLSEKYELCNQELKMIQVENHKQMNKIHTLKRWSLAGWVLSTIIMTLLIVQ